MIRIVFMGNNVMFYTFHFSRGTIFNQVAANLILIKIRFIVVPSARHRTKIEVFKQISTNNFTRYTILQAKIAFIPLGNGSQVLSHEIILITLSFA